MENTAWATGFIPQSGRAVVRLILVAAMKLKLYVDNLSPISQLIEALGPVSFGALITAAFVVLIFNLILFFILTKKFIKVAPVSQVHRLITL